MVYTPIPFGTTDWHIPVNDAFTDQDARITLNEEQVAATPPIGETVPADHNAIAWSLDPSTGVGITSLVAGQLTMVRVEIRAEQTLTSVGYAVAGAGAGLTAGQNFVGLYDATGALLRSTADQSANFGATGYYEANWSTPVVVPAGSYHVAFLANGATPPSLARGASWSAGIGPGALNLGLTAATGRSATSGAGLTALPTPFAMAGRTLSGIGWFSVLR